MTGNIEACIAWSMETEVRLLPLLPDLLADLRELGTSAEQVVSALSSAGVKAESSVLDLGCGKGAVAVALAERLRLRVEGIDAVSSFVEAARELAAERGVGSACTFRRGDIRSTLGQQRQYDVVLLLSVGPIAGSLRETLAGLRTLVRPGGHIVIDDGFLAEGVAQLPKYDGYANRTETLRQLTSFGDLLVCTVECSAEETRSVNEKNTAAIRKRAHALREKHRDLAELLDEYVARQERETRTLGTDLICALWVLRHV